MKEKLFNWWRMWIAVSSLPSSVLQSVATNYYTLKNKPVIFQSKLALQFNLAQCASNIEALVPRARLFHYSLITPSSEILVDHYFLSNSEKILMTIEIIIHYKMPYAGKEFYNLVLFLLAALWHWVELPSLWNSWEDWAGWNSLLGSWSTVREDPSRGLWLCGHSRVRLWFQGGSAPCRSASCGVGGCDQALWEMCPLLLLWEPSCPPTPPAPQMGLNLPARLDGSEGVMLPERGFVMEGWWNGYTEELRTRQETGRGASLSLVSPATLDMNLPVHFNFYADSPPKSSFCIVWGSLRLTLRNAGEPSLLFWLWKENTKPWRTVEEKTAFPAFPSAVDVLCLVGLSFHVLPMVSVWCLLAE